MLPEYTSEHPPEFVLLAGTFLAARGQDGYVHLVNVPQKVVFYGLASLAVLLSAIPLGFFDDKKICKEGPAGTP